MISEIGYTKLYEEDTLSSVEEEKNYDGKLSKYDEINIIESVFNKYDENSVEVWEQNVECNENVRLNSIWMSMFQCL